MRFGVCFFEQRKPRLILVAALRKIQCARAGLVGLAVFLGRVDTINVVPHDPLVLGFVVVGGAGVQLVVDDGVLPFAVCSETRERKLYHLKY
jgi:hypothetical protein